MSENFYDSPNNDKNVLDQQENLITSQQNGSNESVEFVESNTEVVTRRRRRMAEKIKKRKIRKIIILCTSVILALVLAVSCMFFFPDYVGIRFEPTKECVIEISEGTSTTNIAKALEENGVINNYLFFRVFCQLGGYDGSFKYGVYTFSNEMSYKDIALKLQETGASNKVVQVTIPERSNIDDIMRILEENGVCTKADFKKAMKNGNYSDISFVKDIPTERVYYRFEGYLFPDTYEFYNFDSEECAELAIRKMLKRTEELLTEEILNQIKADGKTIHDVITMASIVELEASASLDEMPKVAAVFYNRLVWDEPQRLGSSPTAEYPYGDGRYDTNKVEGLPPGPLCSPSLAAIKASVYPQENFPYTYFVTDSEMKFYYNETYREHNQTIALLKSQGKWIG